MAVLLIDYRMGNLRSVAKALEKVAVEVQVASQPPAAGQPEAIVLPGVGHFGAALQNLDNAGWLAYLRQALAAEIPYLGICRRLATHPRPNRRSSKLPRTG